MSLVRMALDGYRCFARRQDIELRPVTLVLGRNNSGKSALVRAPKVFGTGIRTDSPQPLDLDLLGEEVVDSFTDLVYGGRARESFSVSLGLVGPRGPVGFAATVQHIREHHTQVVSDLVLSTGGARIAALEWELNDPGERPRYTVEAGDETWTGVPIGFRGLLPFTVPDGVVPKDVTIALLNASSHILASYPEVRYFGPFRDRPHRRYRLPGRTPSEVGSTGQHAASILASDKVRHSSRLIEHLNDTFADHLPGWRLDVTERGGTWSVVLTSVDDATVNVNLADAGSGVAQSLPIFVQRALDAFDPTANPILEIIEQPELHLHPAAHAALADLYLSAAGHTSTRFLIETHSETMLLRLRRRIAEGADPETVAVYFVESAGGASTARCIHIDADGNLDYWPAGVFSEDYEETKELARVQWERRDAGAR